VCTREEVRAELEANNRKRDKNLQDKLDTLKEGLVVHFQKQISEIPVHKSSPETTKELITIKNKCSERGTDFALMNQKLNSIEKKLDDFLERMEELEKTKADKEELDRVRSNITWAIRVVVGAVILGLLALIQNT
jgi:predicted  nucleic acid-binding Zn-ribbon protein